MISIIIPAYNVEKYITECLDSLLGQTYSDFEVVVVDDGSTDGTAAAVARVAAADGRVRLVRRANGGVSAARNAGIEASRGEWLMFVDGDDMLLPGGLAALADVAARSGADVVAATYTRRESAAKTPVAAGLPYVSMSPSQAVCDMLYQRRLDPSPWDKLFRRDMFDEIRFRPGTRYEDLDIMYRIFDRAKSVARIDAAVYFYRDVPTSFINSFSESRFDVLDVTQRIVDWATPRGGEEARAARDRRLSASFNMLGLIAAVGDRSRYAETADRCFRTIREGRREALANPRVRLKNKLGALLSYGGRRLLTAALRRHYRH